MKKLLKSRIIVICGYYGSGKTNIAVNLAEEAIKETGSAVIVDLDIVNPYFRTADNAEMLRKMGVVTLIPEFANTNVDIPSRRCRRRCRRLYRAVRLQRRLCGVRIRHVLRI